MVGQAYERLLARRTPLAPSAQMGHRAESRAPVPLSRKGPAPLSPPAASAATLAGPDQGKARGEGPTPCEPRASP